LTSCGPIRIRGASTTPISISGARRGNSSSSATAPLFDLAWLAHSLHDTTSPGGRLLLANTIGRSESGIMTPWLIHTYRDLFGHVGYALEQEETMRGVKETVEFEILISLFRRA
jgi:hypothetical protein